MKIRITALSPEDAYYPNAKVIGALGEFEISSRQKIGKEEWYSGEFLYTNPDEALIWQGWCYFYAIQFAEITGCYATD